jgi:hypothetical protein
MKKQLTLFAIDCGATNWRLFRCVYEWSGNQAQLISEPQASPLTSFSDRKLPAVLCLNASGSELESYGEVAQQQLEDEKKRSRIRESFKPCIGSHLESKALPHQKRYTHAESIRYTQLMLKTLLDQLKKEKWRSSPFDEQLLFTFAYPIHWRYENEGKIFNEFQQLVHDCFPDTFTQIRFVAEPEGALLSLQQQGMLNANHGSGILIIDMGGSSTDIIAGITHGKSGKLQFLGRYGEPFGGSLYDAELAKYLADELQVPASALADDPSAMVSLRITAQHFKESLSRQLLSTPENNVSQQRIVTLLLQNGNIFRRMVHLDQSKFEKISTNLDLDFQRLIDKAIRNIPLREKAIDQVILVGGGAQLFSVVEYLRNRFGAEKVVLADNPDEIVVQGIGLEYGESFEKKEPSFLFPSDSLVDLAFLQADREEIAEELHWGLLCNETEISLQPGIFNLGRSKQMDIPVDDSKASRLHATLFIGSDTLELMDKASTNGTFLNGEQIPAQQKISLKVGDVFAIGKKSYLVTQKKKQAGE